MQYLRSLSEEMFDSFGTKHSINVPTVSLQIFTIVFLIEEVSVRMVNAIMSESLDVGSLVNG